MLPFGISNPYGNTITPWYTGTGVIMAFDSLNIKSGGFADYVGNVMLSSSVSNAGLTDLPKSYIQNGSAFLLNNSWVRNSAGSFGNTVVSNSWTLDYWYKCLNTSTSGLTFNYYMILFASSTTSYYNRLQMGPGSSNNGSKLTVWNSSSGTAPVAYEAGSNTPGFRYTTWTHVALVYNGAGTTNIYINGILYDTISYTIRSTMTGSNNFGILGTNDSSTNTTYFERYRFSNYARWTSNFDLSTIYP